MPDDHDVHADPGEHDALADVDERAGFDDEDDDYEDEDEPGPAGGAWSGAWDPPGPGRPARGSARRRGLLFALTAVVAAAAGFGVVAVAVKDVTGSPAAAGSSPSAAAPSPYGSAGLPSGGPGLAPQAGGVPSLPAGANLRLEVGGPVTADGPTSITIGSGGNVVTAAVTRATKVTGKVAGIGGVKVGDLVSATITGADGKLTADSIQDPASLPSGPGQ
jgi:hypothetical protein